MVYLHENRGGFDILREILLFRPGKGAPRRSLTDKSRHSLLKSEAVEHNCRGDFDQLLNPFKKKLFPILISHSEELHICCAKFIVKHIISI